MEQEQAKELKCESCGAPLPYLAGENVLNCPYCGTTTMLAGHDAIVKLTEHFIIPALLSPGDVQAKAVEWMGDGFFKAGDLAQKARIESLQGICLPFWVVRVRATTYWSGTNRRTRTVGTGNNKRTETYWVPDSGSFEEELGWVVYARSNSEEYWGLAALNPGGSCSSADWGGFPLGLGIGDKSSKGVDLATGKKGFQIELANRLPVINGQITGDQATERAKAQIVGYHRERADGKVDNLTNCSTTVYVHGADLIHAPMWHLKYAYKNKPYNILLDGHLGRVIAGEAPVGKWDKVIITAVAGAVVGAGCVAGAYYWNIPWLLIGGAVAAVAIMVHVVIAAVSD